jgi:hypothetical protein
VPNAVTQVPVRLPMRYEINPAVGETRDYLGITVLAPGVPIPAQELGNPGNLANPGALAFFPHVGPGQVRADGAGIGGVQPLLQADFAGLCGAAAIGARAHAAQAGRCVPAIGPAGAAAQIQAGRAVLNLLCNVAIPCAGIIRLQNARARGGAAAAARVTYAKARFRIGAAGSQVVKPKLTAAGRRLMRGRKKARVWANATTGGKTVASRMTLRR